MTHVLLFRGIVLSLVAVAVMNTAGGTTEGCARVELTTPQGGHLAYKLQAAPSPDAGAPCAPTASALTPGGCVAVSRHMASDLSPIMGGVHPPNSVGWYWFRGDAARDHGPLGNAEWDQAVRMVDASLHPPASATFCATTTGTPDGDPVDGDHRLIIRLCNHAGRADYCAGSATLYDVNSDAGGGGGFAGAGQSLTDRTSGAFPGRGGSA